MFADVFDEIIELATAIVTDWGVVLVLGQPEQRWEATNVECWRNVVGGSIHLDDSNILALQLLTQFLEDWSELLAVAAPWGVLN